RAYMSRDEVQARQLLNDAKRLEPSAEIYILLGRVEANQQRFDSAMEAYQEALKLSGGDQKVRLELGVLQLRRGNPADAVDSLRMVLKDDPANGKAVAALGDALTNVGKYRDALQVYQRALRAGRRDTNILMKSALIQLQQLNQLPQAVKALREVLDQEPQRAEAHYYLGYAYKDMGRSADARRELERFIQQDPDNELVSEVQNDLKDL
ncbi:MAG: tetratricopeptide repeat protein, partial [Myxococcota bacterium]